MTQFIGIMVGGSLGLLAIVAVILLLTVPALRKRVFPHRDRTYYHFGSKGGNSYYKM